MFEKNWFALAAALLLASCASRSSRSPVDEANATVDTSAVAVAIGTPPRRLPLLAIEVEVTDGGVRPLSAKIVHAPPIANSHHGDLTVSPTGAEDFTYTIPDPRVLHIHDDAQSRTEVLESATTVLFVPLLVAVRGVDIQPVEGGDATSPGGSFDIRALAKDACERMRSSLPVCRSFEQP